MTRYATYWNPQPVFAWFLIEFEVHKIEVEAHPPLAVFRPRLLYRPIPLLA